MSVLIKILDNKQLKTLLNKKGYLVNIDYPTKDAKLHEISCRFCNPDDPQGVQPTSKSDTNNGEFWFSDSRNEAVQKAKDIASEKGYRYSLCGICNP